MPVFRWQGIGPNGRSVRGEMEAPNASVVATRLRGRRIRPLRNRIRAKSRGVRTEITLPGLRPRVKPADVVVFTRQLATMIDAGLPIVQALDLLARQTANRTFAAVIAQVGRDVEGGAAFAEALRKHPAAFGELYVSMVTAGELGGALDRILARLADHQEKAATLRAKVRTALIYPASIVGVAVLVTALLLTYVIPVFGQMFASFGKELPLPTRVAIAASEYAAAYFWHVAAGAGVVFFALRGYARTGVGRRQTDRLLLGLPVFGAIVRKAAVARFTQTLSTLTSSGVPILDALAVTGKTAGNSIVEQAVLAARHSVSQGKPLAAPLIESRVFPAIVGGMIQVGETTGALDAMLSKIAEFYDAEVDTAVANLTALMEPLVIVFLGVVIGGLVISMYLPIFQLGTVLN